MKNKDRSIKLDKTVIDCHTLIGNINLANDNINAGEILLGALPYYGKSINGITKYKCPDCNQPLYYHHENSETISLECRECKHLVLARK